MVFSLCMPKLQASDYLHVFSQNPASINELLSNPTADAVQQNESRVKLMFRQGGRFERWSPKFIQLPVLLANPFALTFCM